VRRRRLGCIGRRRPSFAAAKRYCTSCTHAVATGDLNGDGRPDLVTVGFDEISVFITQPAGSRATEAITSRQAVRPAPPSPTSTATGTPTSRLRTTTAS
jgi:hypothetical protein